MEFLMNLEDWQIIVAVIALVAAGLITWGHWL